MLDVFNIFVSERYRNHA